MSMREENNRDDNGNASGKKQLQSKRLQTNVWMKEIIFAIVTWQFFPLVGLFLN
jgi:hypothetical protein